MIVVFGKIIHKITENFRKVCFSILTLKDSQIEHLHSLLRASLSFASVNTSIRAPRAIAFAGLLGRRSEWHVWMAPA